MFARTVACDYSIPDDAPISLECKDLIQCLLVKDPQERYSIRDIMQHPFFRKQLPPGAETLNAICLSCKVRMTNRDFMQACLLHRAAPVLFQDGYLIEMRAWLRA